MPAKTCVSDGNSGVEVRRVSRTRMARVTFYFSRADGVFSVFTLFFIFVPRRVGNFVGDTKSF